jgi:NAD(P)-dependent dehydrogenase (short-subunit alcohol dehydrogenase family)
MKLSGKTAIVTGAARGVAKGVATAFVKAGAQVLIVDREEALGRETEAELRALGGDVAFMVADLANHDALDPIIDEAVKRFGKLDILVNAAQAAQLELIAEATDDGARLAFDTGFWPTFILMRAAYPHLVKTKGCVINFGSGAGFDPMPTQGAYGAAKEAIRAISKVAAVEWGAEGVRVNIVCPFANSPGVQAWKEYAPDDYARQIGKVPLRRIGDCETDIGAAVVFLASEDASYITGHTLMVDGGQTRAL